MCYKCCNIFNRNVSVVEIHIFVEVNLFLQFGVLQFQSSAVQFYVYKDCSEVFIRKLSKDLNGLSLFKR